MLLSLETIPRLHSILATILTWLLLVGFVIIPGAFRTDADGEMARDLAAEVVFMVVGFSSMGVGIAGAVLLAVRWRRNHVWLINKIYLPLVQSGLAGMVAAVVAIYRLQG
ncbi:hypothetical protein QBC47DRAFT_403042 [Echria macrotheca]|uniref:Uncharacterized protein n=1 Tax=Echria macrotheca TaxID=438768 RepID=A0AAJ0BAC6_9PEZI|nr:hypothetical protein QBC47DRAFT_403042 [Echria macrotheca]